MFAAGSIRKIGLLLATIFGTALVIACGCVVNNLTDRNIDRQMRRTKKRALITGTISPKNAALFAAALGLGGFILLSLYTNWVVVVIGVIGLLDYTVLYAVSKRRWVSSTLIGSISGAAPIAAGYCAASGRFDLAAAILFLMMTFWQMPHFYAIALFRSKDYSSAGLPVLPLIRGENAAKKQLLVYCVLFLLSAISLHVFADAGYLYLLVMLVLGIWWIAVGVRRAGTLTSEKWGLEMFKASLWVMIALSGAVSFARILP